MGAAPAPLQESASEVGGQRRTGRVGEDPLVEARDRVDGEAPGVALARRELHERAEDRGRGGVAPVLEASGEPRRVGEPGLRRENGPARPPGAAPPRSRERA